MGAQKIVAETGKVKIRRTFPTRKCSRCGTLHSRRSEFCISCGTAVRAEVIAKWIKEHPERMKEFKRKTREKFHERDRRLAKENRRKNLEAIRQKERDRERRNRENRNARRRELRGLNPQPYRDYARQYRQKFPEKTKSACRAWNSENRASKTEHQRRRDATKRNATIGNPADIQAFYTAVRNASSIGCYWCHRKVPRQEREIDHIIPLSRGGSHSVENLCCSCSRCNKYNKLPEEFSGQFEMFAR